VYQVGKIFKIQSGINYNKACPEKFDSFVTSVATAYFGVMVQLKVVEILFFSPCLVQWSAQHWILLEVGFMNSHLNEFCETVGLTCKDS